MEFEGLNFLSNAPSEIAVDSLFVQVFEHLDNPMTEEEMMDLSDSLAMDRERIDTILPLVARIVRAALKRSNGIELFRENLPKIIEKPIRLLIFKIIETHREEWLRDAGRERKPPVRELDPDEVAANNLVEQDRAAHAAVREELLQEYAKLYDKQVFLCPGCGNEFITIPRFQENRAIIMSRVRCDCCDAPFEGLPLDQCLVCNSCFYTICCDCLKPSSRPTLLNWVRKSFSQCKYYSCQMCDKQLNGTSSFWVTASPHKLAESGSCIQLVPRGVCCNNVKCIGKMCRKKWERKKRLIFRYYVYGPDSLRGLLQRVINFDLSVMPKNPICSMCGLSYTQMQLDCIVYCFDCQSFFCSRCLPRFHMDGGRHLLCCLPPPSYLFTQAVSHLSDISLVYDMPGSSNVDSEASSAVDQSERTVAVVENRVDVSQLSDGMKLLFKLRNPNESRLDNLINATYILFSEAPRPVSLAPVQQDGSQGPQGGSSCLDSNQHSTANFNVNDDDLARTPGGYEYQRTSGSSPSESVPGYSAYSGSASTPTGVASASTGYNAYSGSTSQPGAATPAVTYAPGGYSSYSGSTSSTENPPPIASTSAAAAYNAYGEAKPDVGNPPSYREAVSTPSGYGGYSGASEPGGEAPPPYVSNTASAPGSTPSGYNAYGSPEGNSSRSSYGYGAVRAVESSNSMYSVSKMYGPSARKEASYGYGGYGNEKESSSVYASSGFAPLVDDEAASNAKAKKTASQKKGKKRDTTPSSPARSGEVAFDPMTFSTSSVIPKVMDGDESDTVRNPQLVDSLRSLSSRDSVYFSLSSSSGSVPVDNHDVAEPDARESVQQPAARNWTNEFQTILQMPETTRIEERLKELQLFVLILEFENKVKLIGSRIISEMNLPPEMKTVRSDSNIGGIAGGEKFVIDGIFFKFSNDRHHLYGGDEFAGKATAHELNGLNAYFRYIVCAHTQHSPKLNVPLMTIIDYFGYRIAAMSQLPVDPSTLRYGSGDGGATVHADVPELNAIMREAGVFTNLKEHQVGRKSGVSLCAPCDIEGHVGHDGKYYVLDTARLYPPEAVSKYFNALFFSEKLKAKEMDHLDLEGKKKLVREILLPVQDWEHQLLEVLGIESMHRISFAGGVLCYTGKGELNLMASLLVSSSVFGDAVLIPGGYYGRHLYNLLRPELVHHYPVPLSSDAFTAFGRVNAEEHNSEVRRATHYLRVTLVNKFVDDLSTNMFLSNTREITDEMHRRGINLRYLALCFSQLIARFNKEYTPSTRFVAAELVARSMKSFIRAYLRELVMYGTSIDQILEDAKRMVTTHLNYALCLRDDWKQYWYVIVRMNLQRKYGQYITTLSDRMWEIMYNNASVANSQMLLLKAIVRALGIVFTPNINVLRVIIDHPRTHRCFLPGDIMRLDILTQGRLGVLAHYERRTLLARNDVNIHEEAGVMDIRQTAVTQILGEQSREASVSHLQMALVHCLQRNLPAAEAELAASLAAWPETPVELGAAAFYSAAVLINDDEATPELLATKLRYLRNASALFQLENPIPFVFHPFELPVLDVLIKTLWRADKIFEAKYQARRFNELISGLTFKVPRSTCRLLFGSDTPFAFSISRSNCILERVIGDDDSEKPILANFTMKARLNQDLRRLLSPLMILDSSFSYSVHNSSIARDNNPADLTIGSASLATENREEVNDRVATYTVNVSSLNTLDVIPELEGMPVVSLATTEKNRYYAVTEDGAVYVWGRNKDGLLGVGHNDRVNHPTHIRGELPPIRRTVCSKNCVLFLATNGNIYACGSNKNGCLGTGDTRSRTSPVIVPTLEGEPCIDLCIGDGASYAVSADGQLYFWGKLDYGYTTGNLDTIFTPSLCPVAVDYFSNRTIVKVCANEKDGMVLDSTGLVFFWSVRCSGNYKIRPVLALRSQVIVDIACTNGSFLVVTDEGKVYGWGEKEDAILGTVEESDFEFNSSEVSPLYSPLLSSVHPVSLQLRHDGEHSIGTLVTKTGKAFYWGCGSAAPQPVPLLDDLPVRVLFGRADGVLAVSCGPQDFQQAERVYSVPGMPTVAKTDPQVTLENIEQDGHPVYCSQKFQIHVTSDCGTPLPQDKVLVWPLSLGEPPEILDKETIRKRNVVEAASFLEISANEVGQCVVCLYNCTVETHEVTEENKEVKLRLCVRSEPFEVIPVPLRGKFTASLARAKVYDTVTVRFISDGPVHFKKTRWSGKSVVRASGRERDMYCCVDKHPGKRVKAEVEVVVLPEDFGTMSVRMVPEGGLEQFVGENGETEAQFEITNDSLVESENELVLELASRNLVPLQKTTLRYDMKGNSLGNSTVVAWFNPDHIELNAIRAIGGTITENSGVMEILVPPYSGTFTLRFLRYTSSGEAQFLGNMEPVTVVARKNTPKVFKCPSDVVVGENFIIEVEFDDNPYFLADFVQLVKEGATVPVAGERITTPKTKVVMTATIPGKYEVRYSVIVPGETKNTITATLPLTVHLRDESPAAASAAPSAPATSAASQSASSSEPPSFKTWKEFLEACGVDDSDGAILNVFTENGMELSQISDLDNDVLKELDIKMGPRLKIMKYVKAHFNK